MRSLLTFLLLFSAAFALQLPFEIPFFRSKVPAVSLEPEEPTPRIAIIGAGAGGSSAAFWISKAKERFGIDVEVDVYEREGYIGGRSTIVYPYNDTTLSPMELGASIFVKVNKNLWRASNDFNLTRKNFDDHNEFGVWDGEKFLLKFSGKGLLGSWWTTVKVLWRYGYNAPTKTQSFVKAMTKRFVDLYTMDSPKWTSISSLASEFNWTDMVSQTTSEYLDSHGVFKLYSREMVEAATRVNYGQNVDSIHMLEGACSLAADRASSVIGGNFQIFEQFLNRSGANIFLNTEVQSIVQRPSSGRWIVHSSKGYNEYKSVILAAPFHGTGITIPAQLSSSIPRQPYVHLHVTLLTTTAPHPSPEYFGLAEGSFVPKMVLTTWEGVRQGGKVPEFNSLSYHGVVRGGDAEEGETEWAVKIFSKAPVEDEWLDTVFNGKVGWVHRKEWNAYPLLPPTTKFPPVKLDQGFYYVNAFEPFISTMETETIASRNVVDLLLNEDFDAGICGPKRNESEGMDDFVLGWDC